MRIWLELNAQEAERIFDSVREMTIDRMDTGIVKNKEAKIDEKSSDEAQPDALGNGEGETAEQTYALESDDREGLVRDYLERLLPEKWREMDLYERRSFLNEASLGSRTQGTVRRERVCTLELWCECFGKEAVNLRKSDAYELNAMMAKIEGWEKYEGNKKGNFKFPIYGTQAGYVRVAEQLSEESDEGQS